MNTVALICMTSNASSLCSMNLGSAIIVVVFGGANGSEPLLKTQHIYTYVSDNVVSGSVCVFY